MCLQPQLSSPSALRPVAWSRTWGLASNPQAYHQKQQQPGTFILEIPHGTKPFNLANAVAGNCFWNRGPLNPWRAINRNPVPDPILDETPKLSTVETVSNRTTWTLKSGYSRAIEIQPWRKSSASAQRPAPEDAAAAALQSTASRRSCVPCGWRL